MAPACIARVFRFRRRYEPVQMQALVAEQKPANGDARQTDERSRRGERIRDIKAILAFVFAVLP